MTLKKFLDNWIVKILILVAILGWGFFDAYTDIANIKLLESESYSIEYNKKADEYYIRTEEAEVDLNLYIPAHAEKITINEYVGENLKEEREMFPEEYKENAVKVKKGDFGYIIISSVKGERVTDTVKLYVTE